MQALSIVSRFKTKGEIGEVKDSERGEKVKRVGWEGDEALREGQGVEGASAVGF